MNWVFIFEIAIGLFIGEFVYDFTSAVVSKMRRNRNKKSGKAIFKEQKTQIIGFVDRTKDGRES